MPTAPADPAQRSPIRARHLRKGLSETAINRCGIAPRDPSAAPTRALSTAAISGRHRTHLYWMQKGSSLDSKPGAAGNRYGSAAHRTRGLLSSRQNRCRSPAHAGAVADPVAGPVRTVGNGLLAAHARDGIIDAAVRKSTRQDTVARLPAPYRRVLGRISANAERTDRGTCRTHRKSMLHE